MKLITCTVFVILLLCTACADKQEYPHTYVPPSTPENDDHYPYAQHPWTDKGTDRTQLDGFAIPKQKDTSLKLMNTLNINLKVKAYKTATNNFYNLYDINKKTKDYNSELIENTMLSITTLEQAISQFKNAGGRSAYFSKLEDLLRKDKSFVLLVKHAVVENVVQYYKATDSFYLNRNEKTAKEALEVHAKLRKSIDQFKKSGGDKKFFGLDILERELDEVQPFLESFVYRIA